MRQLINPDSPLMRFLTGVGFACYLGILWLVTSLPFVTAGAATTALYSVTAKLIKNREGALTASFFRAMKENFRQSTIVHLILSVIGCVFALDAYVLSRLWGTHVIWTVLTAIVIGAGVVYLTVILYIYPLMAVFKNTTKKMFQNALLLAVRYLFCTILMGAVSFAAAYVIIYLFTPFLLIAGGIVAGCHAYLLQGIFRKLMPEEEEEEEAEEAR